MTLKRGFAGAIGPISPKISFARTASDTSLSALKPPKRFATPRSASNPSAADIGTFHARALARAGELAPAYRRRPQPRGPEEHHQDEGEAEEQHAQIRRVDVDPAEPVLLQRRGKRNASARGRQLLRSRRPRRCLPPSRPFTSPLRIDHREALRLMNP